MRILGVDPGTRTLGYGLVERVAGRTGPTFAYVECGLVKAPERAPMIERLLVIAQTLTEILAELRPQEVALETAFHGRNAASALKLGQARGAIMLLVAQAGLPLCEYAPSQVKQQVVGHGRATKEDVQQRVRLLLRMKRVPATDAADALAIALCHGTRLLSAPRGGQAGHEVPPRGGLATLVREAAGATGKRGAGRGGAGR
ncbi:crossover junction endodeoxyribonuclease RuvC [Paraliomyxa miuraensis]|uniref:crossover junction endodeoxyribonuclease RuvC n=1 Tax=Paraliomyxa miuraensis TaxID=376150 RepID=UPI002257208C|nr:crossover junction endodeoxyribonuclease RuvC [Paraliomyxa miuraensis]MCX4245916.1 crossover junction endodeoxyribonuclease RuvC [Paraliomyxa miuraensis]